MKKRIVTLLVGAVTASMLLAGCSGSKGLETDELKISVYKGVEIEEVEKPGEVTDEDVESYIQSVRQREATKEEVTDRPVEAGDTATIDFTGRIDGLEFEGGSSEDYPLVIGSGQFIEGFEDSVIGHNAGETYDWQGVFPENYKNAEYAGKDSKEVVPELDDDFVKSVSEKSKTVKEYKEEVKKQVAEDNEMIYEDRVGQAVWEKVLENTEEIIMRMAKEQEEIKAVIFDLDGTLLDTLEDLKEAVNAALLSMNMPVCTLEQVRHYVGNGVRRLMQRAVPDGENNPKFEESFAVFKEFYGEHCLDHTKPYPTVLELLKELKERGVKTAIVSNKLDSAVKELDKRFFGGFTTTAIGERENVARKPAPDMVNEAVAVLGTERGKTLYVGDSEVDIMTAENAGLSCISVTWGFRSEKFLKKNGAKTLIQTPLDLLYLI